MEGEEIRKIIDFNNQEIEKLIDPTTFVLNPKVSELMVENEELRKKCLHHFKNGKCIYCDALIDSLT